MIKLLIVEDEPLVQIGIKSMLNWEDYGITISGAVMNGMAALEHIKQFSPEIVITDIRMPLMDGMELVKTCREIYGRLPLFIILTSYEEFKFAKEALHYQVSDYLVKLELDHDSLDHAVKKVLGTLEEIQKSELGYKTSGRPVLQSFQDKFFIRLLHNLFENEEQFLLQCRDLKLSFTSENYVVTHNEIVPGSQSSSMDAENFLHLYTSTLQMVREMIVKYLDCFVISLDMKHFCILFYQSGNCDASFYQFITTSLEKTFTMIYKYFNVTIRTGIGRIGSTPFLISESYQDARHASKMTNSTRPFAFYEIPDSDSSQISTFNISMFKGNLTQAFEEFNTEILFQTFTEISELFDQNPSKYLQAIDGTCNILYLAISLLPEGEKNVSGIFKNVPDGYRSIYRQSTTQQVVLWLLTLRDGLCNILHSKKKVYKNRIVSNVEKYIQNHIEERLALHDIAYIFGVSPNYLSILFRKYGELGFSEYITRQKIIRAKQLMATTDLKIYEIADQLSFDNAFYFSKVFKKATGCTPREFLQNSNN